MLAMSKDQAIMILAECIKDLSCMSGVSIESSAASDRFIAEHLNSVFERADSVATAVLDD